MRILVGIIVGCFGIGVVSCSSSMGVDGLSKSMADHSLESKNHLYYRGSDAGFDYFVADRHMADERMKLPKGELGLERRFDLTEDSSYWVRLDPYYPHRPAERRRGPNMDSPATIESF